MSGPLIRFYVRNADGSIEADETWPAIASLPIHCIEKGFMVRGEPKTFVLEFDPPLVPQEVDSCS
jgi:hypothetical protein